MMVLVPSIAVQIAKQPVEKEYDLSSLKIILSGTAPLGKEILIALRQKLKCLVVQSYGMTESTVTSHGNTSAFNREGSIGVVLPFNESKVRCELTEIEIEYKNINKNLICRLWI